MFIIAIPQEVNLVIPCDGCGYIVADSQSVVSVLSVEQLEISAC